MLLSGWSSQHALQFLSPPVSVSRWIASHTATSLTTTYSSEHRNGHQRLYSTKVIAKVNPATITKQKTSPQPPAGKSVSTSTPVATKKPPFVSSSRRWGLFGDIHFDDRALERINHTADWIVETFKEKGVSQVCFLNTKYTYTTTALDCRTSPLILLFF